MSTITCTRVLEFDAGHRVHGHESKCATLHGHRYRVEVEATADQLDEVGRIIDFSVLKERIGGWIDEHWDHTVLVWSQDFKTAELLGQMPAKKPPYITTWNPTAENMADDLLRFICPMVLKNSGVLVTRVTVWETPNCKATATL